MKELFKNEYYLSLTQAKSFVSLLAFANILVLFFVFSASEIEQLKGINISVLAIIITVCSIYIETTRCKESITQNFYLYLNLSKANLTGYILAKVIFGFLITFFLSIILILITAIFFDNFGSLSLNLFACFAVFSFLIYFISFAFCLFASYEENGNILAMVLSFAFVIPLIIFLSSLSFLSLLGLFFIYTGLLMVVTSYLIKQI